MYDLSKKCTIYRENVWFTGKSYDLPEKCMIYREKLWFTGKMYDLPGKSMIYWEKLWFTGKMYDLPGKGMIYRKKLWFTEKNVWFHEYSYDFSKFVFYWIYNFFSVFLIHMCIFFSEMTEIQLIINFGGHWEGNIYQGGDTEIILMDRDRKSVV